MARLIDFDKLVATVKECSDRWTLPQREGAELMLDIAEYLVEEQGRKKVAKKRQNAGKDGRNND